MQRFHHNCDDVYVLMGLHGRFGSAPNSPDLGMGFITVLAGDCISPSFGTLVGVTGCGVLVLRENQKH